MAGVYEERVDSMIGRLDDGKMAVVLSENATVRSMRLVLRLARASSCVLSIPSFPVSFSLRPAALFALLLLLSSHSDRQTLSKNRKTFDRSSGDGLKPDSSKDDEACRGKSRVDCAIKRHSCLSSASLWMGWLSLRLAPLSALHLFHCSFRCRKAGSRSPPATSLVGCEKPALSDSILRSDRSTQVQNPQSLEMDELGKLARGQAPLDENPCVDFHRLQKRAFAKLHVARHAYLPFFSDRLIECELKQSVSGAGLSSIPLLFLCSS